MKRLLLSIMTILSVAGLHAQSLSLNDCRQMALEYSEQVKTADNNVRKAQLDREIAFAQYLPKLDGSVTAVAMKDREFGPLTLQLRGTYLAGVNLTLPLYAGGQITAANKLAGIGKTVSEEQLRKARMQVIADVDNAYYTLISVQSKVRMLEAYAEQMQGLYDQVKISVDADLATNNELLRISAKQNEISYQLQKARNGEQLCQLALANIIGTPFDSTITPTDTIMTAQSVDGLTEDFSMRPDLILLKQQVEASKQQVKMARSNYLPTVALVGSYSYFDNLKAKLNLPLPDGSNFYFKDTFNGGHAIAILSVSVPIFHWGAEVKKVKKAKLDLDNSRLQLQQYERGMSIEVRQAVLNLTDGQRMLETAQLGQQQADENLRVMRQKYDNQYCTMTDLLDAQSQWHQARSNLIEAQTQQKINETEYLRVTGQLSM